MLKAISNLKVKNRFAFDIGAIFLFAMLITFPIYLMGIPGGYDMPQHFQFAQTFYDSLMNGTFFPSWAHQPIMGYGDVSVRFYPPLTYYVMSFFRIVTGDWYEGSCLAIAFFFFVSGTGAYLWAREWFSENSSLFGALVYIFAPYHLNQIYQATLFAEFAAAAILPFCFLYATRVCQKGRNIDIYALALSFGLLILTHIPTTVMASIALFIYVIFSLRKTDFIRTIAKLALSVSFAVLLSSFYWVRMVTELDWVKHNLDIYSSGYFSYQSHFAFSFLAQMVGIELGSSATFLNYMTLVTLGLLIPNVFLHFLNAKEKKEKPLVNVFAMTAFTLFMVTPFSLFIWNNLTFLQKIQFPWRWMIFVSLGCAIFAAASFEILLAYFKTPRRYLAILAIGLMFIIIPYNGFRVVNHIFYYPKDFFTGLAERLKTSPSYECWWTTWAEKAPVKKTVPGFPRPSLLADKVVVNDRNFEVTNWKATDRTFTVEAGEAGQGFFATLYYPHWKVTVNGTPVEVTPSEFGMISFNVPAEKSDVHVYFEEPSHVVMAYYFSGFAWLFLLALLFLYSFKNLRLQKNEAEA